VRPLVHKEIMKLVPVSYKISMLPAFFNHLDGERIGSVIRDSSYEFLADLKKKIMFSIAVKIFPYGSEVNSVRIIIVKFSEEIIVGEDGEDDGTGSRKTRTKSRKSGSSAKSRSRSKANSSNRAGSKAASKAASKSGDPQDAPPPKK